VPPYFLRESVERLAVMALLAAHRGRLAEALTLATRAVELAETSDFLNLRARTWLALAEVQRQSGAAAQADAATEKALRLYEAKGNVAGAADVRAGRAARPTY
jgi:hypothetical protein